MQHRETEPAQSSGNPSVSFRAMRLEDIPDVMIIEHESFSLPWTEQAFRSEMTLNHFARYLIMEVGGKPAGYAGMWTVIDEAHITNIAVRTAYRGRKLGERLLNELLDTAKALGLERATLEVRVSNGVARNLYTKMGFREVGIRKGYYSDNNEDAVIMVVDLKDRPKAAGNTEGSV
ncbi:ribosomal protein S18-alanine N-acetyltransferase [Saccharibacillus alkalitolerans]|uniref:Ribosomal protein S18-alanine N-acetyltransferase n=1 Tax=Saccharibacillus alkalitolerans TaxID=2705290 RepID=A0ABX0F1H2_9BACL|nr:ribosomal protein S18-alanine N-acetyltransferase [Saccharibacillus alkalitolerans]NGZ74828.1 ribosomal protein S18-alanine N-acetyltransferase [Saccharibacillus alkalitolerans]